jgi:hypothetical protein
MFASNSVLPHISLINNRVKYAVVFNSIKENISMKRFLTALFIAVLGLGVLLSGTSAANVNTTSLSPAAQVVPVTKRVSKKVYRKGRWVTVTTWKHGKRITKRVWRKGYWIGGKVGAKTKDIVMGKDNPRP